MKKIILVHGWDGSPDEDWFPWAIKTLKDLSYEVVALTMPNPEAPRINEWLNSLTLEAEGYHEGTIFVGHSIGCQAIMRYLETQHKKAGAAIFVAGWFNLTNLEDEEAEAIAKPWIETPINTEKIKSNLLNVVAILGDNDRWVPYKETKRAFEEKLGADVVTISDGGHITSDDGFGAFPQLIEQVTSMK